MVQATHAAASPTNPPTHGAMNSMSPMTDRAQWSLAGFRASNDHIAWIAVNAPNPSVRPAPAAPAKITIYRRYSNRGEMLAASLSSVAEPESPADTAILSKVVQWVVEQSLHVVESSIGAGGVAALLADDDPEFTTLIRSLLVQHRRHLSTALRRALDAESPRSGLDVETLLDMIVGAYLAEVARSGSVRPGWSERVVSILGPMIAAGGPSH